MNAYRISVISGIEMEKVQERGLCPRRMTVQDLAILAF